MVVIPRTLIYMFVKMYMGGICRWQVPPGPDVLKQHCLHRAGIPVCIYQAELLKARFLGEEKIGIVPSGVFPAYCHSYFPGEDVIDFMHLPDEKDVLEQLLPHCIWQPLDAIKLKKGDIDNGQSE